MHLPTIRARRAVQARLDQQPIVRVDERLRERHPRDVATDWIRTKIQAGDAGLDPYDPSIFILVAGRNEKLWAYCTLELVGEVVTRVDQIGGRQRLRAVLEADARLALGLDETPAPLMLDEPLSSRSVESTSGRMDMLLASLDPERESSSAIRRAYGAYEERTRS